MKKAKAKEIDPIDQLRQIIEEEAAGLVTNARQRIRESISKAANSLIGLSGGFGGNRAEIDHCNGRSSVLIDAFRKCAQEEAEKIATQYRPSSETVVQHANAFRSEFNRHLHCSIENLAKERAKEEAKKIIDAIEIEVDQTLSGVLRDR